MNYCTINPITRKKSNLAGKLGMVRYNNISNKYYNTNDLELNLQFSIPNSLPVYNPAILDENGDFKLFKRTKVELNKNTSKYVYELLEGEELESSLDSKGEINKNKTDIVILPTPSISHYLLSEKPIVTQTKNINNERIVTRIESLGQDIGVSINNLNENSENDLLAEEQVKLKNINNDLKKSYKSLQEAYIDIVFKKLDKTNRTKLLKTLRAKSELLNSNKVNSARALKNLNEILIKTATISNDPILTRAIDNFLQKNKSAVDSNLNYIFKSVKQKKVVDLFNHRNTEVIHNESIKVDLNGHKLTHPLTGQWLLNHEYHLYKDENGNLLKEPQRVETSVTNEIDIYSPFNRFRKILDVNLGNKRWQGYFPKFTIELLLNDEYNEQPLETINPYEIFENKKDRIAKFVTFETKQVVVDIVKAAMENDQQKILDIIIEFNKNSKKPLKPIDLQNLVGGLLGKRFSSAKDYKGQPDISQIKQLMNFPKTTKININDLKDVSDTSYYLNKNLIYKFRELQFGTIAGTYIHGIVQSTMGAAMKYGTDVLDSNGNIIDIEIDWDTMISENSEEGSQLHDFVEYAKEIKERKANSPEEFERKLGSPYQGAINTIINFKKLAKEKYAELDENGKPIPGGEPILFFENIALTRNYRSLLPYNKGNRNLASKIDVSVVFPNGKVMVIDVKSSTRNKIKASSITNPEATERYNLKEDEELKEGQQYPEKKSEGYSASDQSKHSKQLEIYRKMLIDGGIQPEDIETYIFFVAVEEIDKSKPIDNSQMTRNIDNVFDAIGSTQVPNFKPTDPNSDYVNKSNEYDSGPHDHLIPGDTLNSNAKNRKLIDKAIGKTSEEIYEERANLEFLKALEKESTEEFNKSIDSFKKDYEEVRNQINDYLAKTERIVQTTRVLNDAEKKAKIKQIKELSFSLNEKTDDTVSNIVSIIKFIDVAYKELLGDTSPDFSKNRSLGLLDNMIDVINNYSQNLGKKGYDDFELLNESISKSQYLYDIISQFKTLKDIINLNNITNGMLFTDGQIKKLNRATAAYDRAMKLYDKNSVKMISQNLMMYHDSNLDRDYNKILNNKIKKAINAGEFTQQDLDSYQNEMKSQNNTLALLKSNPKYQKIYAIYDSIHHLNISAEEIESELIELRRDIGGFSVHVLGAGMQNNRVLQLVFKKFKTEVALGEQKTKEDHIKLDEAFQKYIEAVGRSNNMEELYGHILEKKKQKRWNSETKKVEEHEVWQFINEYDTDYMLQLDELIRQRNEARENNNKIKERELIEEIKNWELENLEKIYVDEYYEIDKLLSPELKEAIKKIDDGIFEIRSKYPTNNPATYTNEDKESLKKLYLEKQQLGSLYDKNVKKTGKELEMALQYQEYKKKRGEFVESELDVDSYNKAFQEAKIKYKDDPVMLQRWIDANSDIVLSDDFYDRHLLLSLQKNILVTLMNSKHSSTPKLAAKYNGLKRMISTNPNEFVEQMRKFIRENEIEFYNNSGEEILNALEMLKPYRDNRGIVDYKVVPAEVTTAVKNLLEKNAEDRFKEFKKVSGKSLPSVIDNKSAYSSEYRAVMELKREHESFVINSDYYDILERHLTENDIDIDDYTDYTNKNFANLSKDKKDRIKDFIENNTWFKNNHYKDYKYVYKDDKNKTEDNEFTNRPDPEDIIYGKNNNTSKYWVVEELKPISVWTRMVPAQQDYVKLNQEKLRSIIGLSKKHNLNDLKITLKSDKGADIKVPMSKLISILNSEEGIEALGDLKQSTRGKNVKNSYLGLSYLDNAYMAVKGEHSVQILDIINGVTNTIKTELDKSLNALKTDPDQENNKKIIDDIQRSVDLIEDYSIKIDDNGAETIRISRALFDVEADTLEFYQKRPNILYNRVSVKKRFLKEENELIKIIDKNSFKKVIDENGNEKTVIDYDNLKPKPLDKWRNKRYDQMMSDTSVKGEAIKEFYKSITDFYLKKQEQYPPHKRRGLVLPSRRKSVGELLANKQARGEKISQTKSKAKQLGKRVGDVFRADQDDIEDEGINAVDPNEDYEFALQSSSNIEIFGAGFENNSITLPVLYTQQMDADDVSLDIISSMQHFSHATNKYQALEKTIDTVRAVNTAFEKREENNKVIERDNKDRALVKNLAKSLMANSPVSFKGKNETSNIFKYFQIFIDQQYKGINNRPSFAGSVRIDKAVDKLMGAQSVASIGGINPLAALKGTVNAMQASMSVAIEAAAGEYFSAYTLKKVIGPTTQYDLYKDQILEMKATAQGSTISVTKTGMLLDHYDALQGNFVDSMGDNVSSGAVLKLFKSSTWFFNQYFGEYLNSMTVLNSFLEEHKVMDDGSVTTWKEYSQTPDIIKLPDSQYKDARRKFRERPSLRSSIEVAEDGKRLINKKVKLPNGSEIEINKEWQLGGKEDINLRLKVQALSRELNGAYAQADKTGMQQAWYGRALMMYKKYLVPSLKRRFSGTSYASQELGSVRTGYHYDHYNLAFEAGKNFFLNKQADELKELGKLYVSILTGGRLFGLSERFANGRVDSNGNLVEGKFTLSQVANIRKSLFEHIMLLTMLLLLKLIDIDDDENKEDISNARYIAIYLLDRLKREQNAMAINPFIGNPVKDNWKNLESPSAIIKTVKDLMDITALTFQHISPFSDKEDLYYKNDYGIAEKGDSKRNIKFRKTVKVFDMWGGQTLETLIENMRRN